MGDTDSKFHFSYSVPCMCVLFLYFFKNLNEHTLKVGSRLLIFNYTANALLKCQFLYLVITDNLFPLLLPFLSLIALIILFRSHIWYHLRGLSLYIWRRNNCVCLNAYRNSFNSSSVSLEKVFYRVVYTRDLFSINLWSQKIIWYIFVPFLLLL